MKQTKLWNTIRYKTDQTLSAITGSDSLLLTSQITVPNGWLPWWSSIVKGSTKYISEIHTYWHPPHCGDWIDETRVKKMQNWRRFLTPYICRQGGHWQRPVPTCSWQSPLSETFCRPGGRTVNGLRGRTDIRKRSDMTQWLKSAISYQICYLLDWLFGGNSFRTKKYESKEFIMFQPKRVKTKIEASFVSPL